MSADYILPAMRAKLLIEHRLVMDNHQNEVLVGLSSDESRRLVHYWNEPATTKRQDRKDKHTLDEKHRRAHMWWRRCSTVHDLSARDMTASEAFEIGRAAWNSQSALSDLERHTKDFDAMIATVPQDRRLAAIHGWLNAFDDEADRLSR
ncbi:hypothetical protein ACO2JO_01210 [Leptospira interrogans]